MTEWTYRQTIRFDLERDSEPESLEESNALLVVEALTEKFMDNLRDALPRGFRAVER